MRRWIAGLPTEYQLCLTFALFMLVCFFVTPISPTLDKNLAAILTGLGALSGGALAHGISARWGKQNANVDLMGDQEVSK